MANLSVARLGPVGFAGRLLAVVGSLAVVAGSLLPYLDRIAFSDLRERSFWEVSTRADLVVIVLAVAALAIVVASVAVAARPLLVIAALAGALALGQLAPLEATSLDRYGIGLWVMLVGALAILVGALAAAVAPAPSAPAHAAADAPTGRWSVR